MRFGLRIPNFNKRISARLSPARAIRHSLGFKAPHGGGSFSKTGPRRTSYNAVYRRTTVGWRDINSNDIAGWPFNGNHPLLVCVVIAIAIFLCLVIGIPLLLAILSA
jgi:hypothetical protein